MSNAHFQAIDTRAKRILAKANTLGFTKNGSPMVIDQAREIVASEEGARNWHVLQARLKQQPRTAAADHAPALLAALGIAATALDRMADGADFDRVVDETGVTYAVLTAQREAKQAGITPGPAYGDMLRTLTAIGAQNDIWTKQPDIDRLVNAWLQMARDVLKMRIDSAGDLVPIDAEDKAPAQTVAIDEEEPFFKVIHERSDGQVFAVEQHGDEYMAVYPKDLADLAASWETPAGAEHTLREDLNERGIVPNEGMIDREDGLSRRHCHEASEQGWNLFDADGRELQIQREDDADVFPGDGEAWSFVIGHAIANPKSAAARAVQLIKALSPEEYQRLAAHAAECAMALPGSMPPPVDAYAPAYLVCERWSHCFIGNKESIVRWVFQFSGVDKVVYAELQSGPKWITLDRAAMDDIEDSLFDNNVPDRYDEEFPDEVIFSTTLPAFAPKDL